MWAVQSPLNWSTCRLEYGLGLGPVKHVLDGCTLEPPGKYDWTVHVRRWCDLFVKLLRPVVFLDSVARDAVTWWLIITCWMACCKPGQLIYAVNCYTQFTWYDRLSNQFYNRFDNRLYRVNGALVIMCLSMLLIISHQLNGVCASVVFDMALVKHSPARGRLK